MIKLFMDKDKSIEIKESINFGEAKPGEIKEVNFYLYAENEVRDLKIKLNDPSKQIVLTSQPPVQMIKEQIWRGTLMWKAGNIPPKSKPGFDIQGTEVLSW